MCSLSDPDELTHSPPPPPSFEDFQRQASLMTTCTLLWKELSDHFSSLEKDLLEKSDALRAKLQALDTETQQSLKALECRESSISESMSLAFDSLKKTAQMSISFATSNSDELEGTEVDKSENLLMKLTSYCHKMAAREFWIFITTRKKDLELLGSELPKALAACVDPPRFVLEAISDVFPIDKRELKSNKTASNNYDFNWGCVLLLESLIPVMVDPVLGKERMLITPTIKGKAEEIAETWKKSLEERGGIDNVKTPDVQTFLQHLVTFGVMKKEDVDLYRKLVVASAWRKQMPKLAVSLGLGDKMPEMINELIGRGQQVDAVHFIYEAGLSNKFPPVPLLEAFVKDAKKAATSMLEDPDNSGRAAHLAMKKEQSAIRAVLKCIEVYKLEAEFPPEDLRKQLEVLEKVKAAKVEKRKPAASSAAKRTRISSNGGPMPPAKAGRSTNAYVSSFPSPPTYVRSPTHTEYPTYPTSPALYGHGSRGPLYAYSPDTSPPYSYSPEAAPPYAPDASPHYTYSPEAAPPPIVGSYPVSPVNYSPYGGYGNGIALRYHGAYY